MNKNRIYLSKRLFIVLLILIMLNVILFAVCLRLRTNSAAGFPIFPIFLLILVFIITLAFLYVGVLSPYRSLSKMSHLFANGQIYDEFFCMNYGLSPENDRSLSRLRTMVSGYDAINLSQRQAEYLALQNQINPHFLYNTLEAIRGDALSIHALEIAQTTEALSTFFRYTITETKRLVPIEREISNVESYFRIQQYRFGSKLRMNVEIEDDRILRFLIPKLTLQPLIENAIFHGLEKRAEGGTIILRLQMTGKRILINVIDNGVGMDKESVDFINERLEGFTARYNPQEGNRGTGIALYNVSQRIKLIFGDEYGLRIYSIKGMGTEVWIDLPQRLIEEREPDT